MRAFQVSHILCAILAHLTVSFAQSPVECVAGLTDADQDGNFAIDWTEYQMMLMEFAWSHHQCRTIPNVTLLQTHYDDAACSCRQYRARADIAETPICSCWDATASIAVPRTYPLQYSIAICESISHVLNTTCELGHDAPSVTPAASSDRSAGPIVASVAAVVVVLAIMGALVWRRPKGWPAQWHCRLVRRMESKGDAPPATVEIPSGKGHEGSFETTESETEMEEGELIIFEQKDAPSPLLVAYGRDVTPSPSPFLVAYGRNVTSSPPPLLEAFSSCSSLEVEGGTDSSGSHSSDEERAQGGDPPIARAVPYKERERSVLKLDSSWDELDNSNDPTTDESDDDDDLHGPIDVDRVVPMGPIDIDDGQMVPASVASLKKPLPCHRRKHAAIKVRSVKGVRAAYMEKARARSSRLLKPIPEATLTRAKLLDI